jgi:beta-phosphoglucomutase-like phosphatase (HAD superfamily)
LSSHENLAGKNPSDPAILFDLDRILLDTAYDHGTAWSTALASAVIVVPKWKIHRQLLREVETLAKSPMYQPR